MADTASAPDIPKKALADRLSLIRYLHTCTPREAGYVLETLAAATPPVATFMCSCDEQLHHGRCTNPDCRDNK